MRDYRPLHSRVQITLDHKELNWISFALSGSPTVG